MPSIILRPPPRRAVEDNGYKSEQGQKKSMYKNRIAPERYMQTVVSACRSNYYSFIVTVHAIQGYHEGACRSLLCHSCVTPVLQYYMRVPADHSYVVMLYASYIVMSLGSLPH